MLHLFTVPGPLRRFLLASLQSSVGNGIGYVALLLLAYEQFRSPWAITLVLMAEFVPSIVFGGAFGALADRVSRKHLAVGADVARVLAFAGIALSGSFALTLALAFVAGAAQTLYQPASKAALPGLAGDRLDDAMGALVFSWSLSTMAGPAIGALMLLVTSPQTLMLANAATFLVSAVVLSRLPLAPSPSVDADEHAPDDAPADHRIRAGLEAIAAVPGVSLVVAVAVGANLSFGMINIAEPLLANGPLDAGSAGFSILVAAFGVGSTLGAAAGRSNATRMLGALAGVAAALACTAAVPTLETAAIAFVITGYFAGMLISCEQRLTATLVPTSVQGRVYGLKDSMESAAFLAAYVIGGALASFAGVRTIYVVTAVATAALFFAGVAARQRLEPRMAAEPVA